MPDSFCASSADPTTAGRRAGDCLARPLSLHHLAELTSDIYLDLKRTGRQELAIAFGLAYLKVIDEIERSGAKRTSA